ARAMPTQKWLISADFRYTIEAGLWDIEQRACWFFTRAPFPISDQSQILEVRPHHIARDAQRFSRLDLVFIALAKSFPDGKGDQPIEQILMLPFQQPPDKGAGGLFQRRETGNGIPHFQQVAQSKVGGLDAPVFADQGGPMDSIVQFADIAGPVMLEQDLFGRRAQFQPIGPQPRTVDFQKMPRKG